MKLSGFISLLFYIGAAVHAQTVWPLHNDSYNDVVEWDHYSYIVNGQRLYIWSGEVHYWRVPVPEVWVDILEKVKAAGFNTVSFYGHWGYHSASEGALDFESGAHNYTSLFTIAKEIGLYIIFRPGPYINAETTAGGFPGWLTTGAYGTLRNNDSRYTAAWKPYWIKMAEIISPHQVSNGGNVLVYQIENEYGDQWSNVAAKTPDNTAIAYMEDLEETARSAGLTIPFTHNNPNMNTKSWSTDYGAGVGGDVNIYGLDSYPDCWSCNLAECGSSVIPFTVQNYFNNFQQVSPTQPSFLAEFQGGAYLPWGGPEGGCLANTGVDWVNVFYRHNIAQKVTAQNIYMSFGGTNWGGLAFPTVGTSYDYSAPISESRVLPSKYSETKLYAQFLRVARDLTKVDLIANGTDFTNDSTIYVSQLRNPDTNAAFYVTIHTSSPSTAVTPFRLAVTTSLGNLTIPQSSSSSILLNGRQSKIIVTDFPVGSQKLVYSTAEVFTVSTQDSKPLIFLWLPAGESGEFYLTGVKSGSILKSDSSSGLTLKTTSSGIIVSWTQAIGSSVVKFDNEYRVVLLDRTAAYNAWVPSTSADPYTPENSTVVVQGPYLVRSAAINGDIISVTGDWANTTTLEVFAPSIISKVKLNGNTISVSKTSYGSLVGTLDAGRYDATSLWASLPALTSWKVNEGLPEALADYDDSRWTVANHSSTSNPTIPATHPVLYADDYGYHTGNILYRGRFLGSKATGVFLSIYGGTSHGWSAYLNGVFIGSWLGTTSVTQSSFSLSFANATLYSNTTNVLFVIQDHMGHDETSGATNPRGIYNATLLVPSSTQTFTSWKIAGNAGAESNIDPIRGPYGEGGLHGERLGWHLPGFDDSHWSDGSPAVGFPNSGAKFYRTVVRLDIDQGLDASLGFVLGPGTGNATGAVRAQLYINGYQFGKYVPYIGNQVVFPVYPGILNYRGENTIALSVWAQETIGGSVSVDWTVLGVVESSFNPSFDASYLQPGWTDRSAYY